MKLARQSRTLRRTLLLLALAASAAWTGCLGDEEPEERLAKPLDAPVAVPLPTSARPSTPPANLSDPGYRMSGPWRVGDAWDYESNASRVLRVRVVDQRAGPGGATHYLLEERRGTVGDPAMRVTRVWIDGAQWLRLNATGPDGAQERHQPGAPLRALRNATLAYETTRLDPQGRTLATHNVSLVTRLHAPHQTLLFPWGYVEARVVDQNATMRDATGARTSANTTRWVHADYLNDVQFATDTGELFKLTAVRAGEFRRGTLAG